MTTKRNKGSRPWILQFPESSYVKRKFSEWRVSMLCWISAGGFCFFCFWDFVVSSSAWMWFQRKGQESPLSGSVESCSLMVTGQKNWGYLGEVGIGERAIKGWCLALSKRPKRGTSLVVQWLGVCLLIQRTWVRSLVRKILYVVEQLSPCDTSAEAWAP